MIPGTPHSPGQAFIAFAREFLEALSQEDYQAALGRLDMTEKRWSKNKLVSDLQQVLGTSNISSSKGLEKSASPLLEQSGSEYLLRHRLPVLGEWSDAKAVFEFKPLKPNSSYFKVILRGFEP